MRGELSTPAMRANWPMRAEPAWSQVLGIFKSQDFAVVIIVSLVGLLVSALLTSWLPFSDKLASALALAS